MIKNVFNQNDVSEIIERINNLSPESQAQWGKMSVAQMLAHCNISYEYVFEPDKHKKAGAFVKFMLKLFVKNKVVNEVIYKQNSQTAPDFIIKDEKNFDNEKVRLIAFVTLTLEKGADYFDNYESHSFGKLNKNEWNNMFYKHLDHHLRQFGV
jgi:hypothetical protein